MSQAWDPAARRVETAAELRQFGPPLIVPGGPFETGWFLSGNGRQNGTVTQIHVTSHERGTSRRSVSVRTGDLAAGRPDTNHLVLDVLLGAVDHDIALPLTLTVAEREASLRLADGVLPVTLIECGNLWAARGLLGDRWVVVVAKDVAVDEVSLIRIDDLDALPEDRYTAQ